MENEIEVNGKKYVLKDSIKVNPKTASSVKGKTYCIVRTYSAGVFAGFIDLKVKGQERIVYNARRLWQWTGASSLSQLAMEGSKTPNTCKFPVEVNEVYLTQVIEIIPCTEIAKKNIASVPIWEQ
jgi:hypothetical protein